LGLSIYNLILSRREKQPQLCVTLKNGFLTYGPELSELMLMLEVANRGEKVVTVSSVAISFGKQITFFPRGIEGTTTVPFELALGKSATFWTPLKEFTSSLRRQGVSGKAPIRARFASAVGDEFLSKPFKLDVNHWSSTS
jgi:hypothetical protein